MAYEVFCGRLWVFLVMLILSASVRFFQDRSVVAISQSCDSLGVRVKGEQTNIVHQLRVIRDLGGNTIGRLRAIRGRQARPPVARLVLSASPLDATLNIMNAAEIPLEPLPVRNGESLAQRAGVSEHGINDAEVAPIGHRAEELSKASAGRVSVQVGDTAML